MLKPHPQSLVPTVRPSAGGTRLRLRAAVLLAGAATMILELLGARIVGPHFGAGLYVWTSLITVTLAALALGYWAGGVYADRRPQASALAWILLGAALSVALIPFLRAPTLELGWHLGLRMGALTSASILFFVPVFLLGMVPPCAIRLEAGESESTGRSVGRVLAVSTLGSVAGALLAGFVLIPGFRIPTLLGLLSGGLSIAAVIVALPVVPLAVSFSALAVVHLAGFAAWPTPKPPALLEVRSHQGSDLRVVSHGGSRYLFADQVLQSSINPDGKTLDQHAYLLASRVLIARPDAREAALIGVGGGCFVPLLMQNGMDLECVDESPEVFELARRHFGFRQAPERVHVADGRVFLRQNPGRFDVVVFDVFAGDRMPAALISKEGFETAKAALKPGGLVAINTWGLDEERGGPNAIGVVVKATLSSVFGQVFPVPAAGNLLFFASDQPIEPLGHPVRFDCFDGSHEFTWIPVSPTVWPPSEALRDDHNPLDDAQSTLLETWRTQQRRSLPEPILAALAWE